MSTPGYCLRLSDAALAALNDYEFPGNIRELENILERAAAFANDGCIEPDDLVLRGKRRVQLTASKADATLEQSAIIEDAVEPEIAQERVVFPFEMLAKQDAVDASQVERFRDAVTFGVPSFPFSLPDFLEDIERELIRRALVSTRYKRTQAAELLGVSFRQLRYQIQKLKIHDDE
jgi:two-component system, NtrC family, response regulator PilR